jgi:hypothetical protein
MSSTTFTLDLLESGLGAVLASPKDHGVPEYIISRTGVDFEQ